MPVRHSNARALVVETGRDAHWTGIGRDVQVRCGHCGRRLFDVTALLHEVYNADVGAWEWFTTGVLEIEKACGRCKRKGKDCVTGTPGEPLSDGLSGPWRCDCGQSLARVDGTRGRVRTTCRCGMEVGVTASDAIATRTLTDLPPLRVPTSDAPVEHEVLDDIPF